MHESTGRMMDLAGARPLTSVSRIALTAVDSGFNVAPAVQSAYTGACASVLADAIWKLRGREGQDLPSTDRGSLVSFLQEHLTPLGASRRKGLRLAPNRLTQWVLGEPEVPRRLLESAARNVFGPRGIPVDIEHCERELVACAGSSLTLHEHALQGALEAGRTILVPEPYFGPFASLTTRGGATLGRHLATLPTRDSGYRLTPRVLEEAIRQHGRDRLGALLFTNPNNPTFQVQDRAEMQGLADLIARYELPVVCDELYAELQRPGLQHVSLASLRASDAAGGKPLHELVLTTTGTSKLFNLDDDNLRSGVACSGNREWIAQIQRSISLKGQTFSRARALAGAVVYQHSDETYRAAGRALIARASARFQRDVAEANERLGWPAIQSLVTPQAAFYDCISLDPELCRKHGITDSNQLFEYLYMCTGVLTAPLTLMGTDTLGVRLNVMGNTNLGNLDAQLDEVSMAVSRLEELARMMRDGRAPSYEKVQVAMDRQRMVQGGALDARGLLQALLGMRIEIR